jgi:hypothetical protein
LTGGQAFAASATITSPYFEGSETIWGPYPTRGPSPRISEKTGDTYPWRFKIRKDHSVDVESAVPATSLLEGLRFVKRWPAEHWRLAFQGNVHELDDDDFALIEDAILRQERAGRAA